jgi:hypothetical protein
MKKLLFILILINSFLGYSQNYSYFDSDSKTKIIYEYVTDKGDINKFSIKFNLTIQEGNNEFRYDGVELNSVNYRNKISLQDLLLNNYKRYLNDFGIKTLKSHRDIIMRSLADYSSKKNYEEQHSLTFQGFLLYVSILNGSDRDVKSNAEITFTPYDGYLNAISSFVCEEDIIINTQELKDYISNKKKTDSENVGNKYYEDILPLIKNPEISSFEIRNLLLQSFKFHWPDGGMCGCCGNYDGPCLYWNWSCYLHDLACQRCQHWWCFSGCQPTSCNGNTLPWYP